MSLSDLLLKSGQSKLFKQNKKAKINKALLKHQEARTNRWVHKINYHSPPEFYISHLIIKTKIVTIQFNVRIPSTLSPIVQPQVKMKSLLPKLLESSSACWNICSKSNSPQDWGFIFAQVSHLISRSNQHVLCSSYTWCI